jgi:hypothetical protein
MEEDSESELKGYLHRATYLVFEADALLGCENFLEQIQTLLKHIRPDDKC